MGIKKNKEMGKPAKKIYELALRERLNDLTENLVKIIREGDASAKTIAKKKCILETITEIKIRIYEVKTSAFDGTCKKCSRPITLLHLQDHLVTDNCKKCDKKSRILEMRCF